MQTTDPTRSATMRAVRSRGTGPESRVRALLRPIAPGYRLHRKDIPGRPDFAYVGRKIAIFVHGCFWHSHDCKRGARLPKDNAVYWSTKIARNRARDARVVSELLAAGWKVETIWECTLKDEVEVAARLCALLTHPSSARR